MPSPARFTAHPLEGSMINVGHESRSLMHRLVCSSSLAFLGLSISAYPVAAQVTSVTLQGMISNEEGNPVPEATISVTNSDIGSVLRVISDEEGRYTILGIVPGTYTVHIHLIGYADVTLNGVRFITGQRPVLDFVLRQTSIELEGVETFASKVDEFEFRRVDVSTMAFGDQIRNLPLNSRTVLNLAALAPGIRSYSGSLLPEAGPFPPSIRPINLYVDGAEWKSLYNGSIVGLPQSGSPMPQDAVQELRAIVAPFDVEFTRGGSYVLSVLTRSGSNKFHAEAFSFLRNQELNSRGPFETTKPAYSRSQTGVTLSGPLVRDKLFAFGSYEVQDARSYLSVVPGRPFYSPPLWDTYRGTFEAPTKNQTGLVRITYAPTGGHTLDATWASRNLSGKGGFGNASAERAATISDYSILSFMVKHTWLPSPSMMNEASIHYLRWRHVASPAYPGPAYVYPSITLGRSDIHQKLDEDQFHLIDKFTTIVRNLWVRIC